MELECQVSKAEVREAMRMNLTVSFWLRAVLVNVRLLAILAVVGAAAVTGLSKQEHGFNWRNVVFPLLITIFLIGLYVFRMARSVGKAEARMNAECSRVALDVQGLTISNAAGARSFTPWTQFHRWKEGKLVFTVGDAKAYRTIPKRTLSEMQVHEVRGLLGSQVR